MMWLRKQVVQEHHEGNFWVRLLTPSFFSIGIAIVGVDAPPVERTVLVTDKIEWRGEPCVVTAVQTDTMEWVRDPDSPFLKPSTLPEEFPTSDLKQRVTQRGLGGGRLVNEYQCQDIPSPEWVVPLDENTLGHQIVHGDPPKKSREKGLTWEDYMDDGTDGNAYLGPSDSPGKVGK